MLNNIPFHVAFFEYIFRCVDVSTYFLFKNKSIQKKFYICIISITLYKLSKDYSLENSFKKIIEYNNVSSVLHEHGISFKILSRKIHDLIIIKHF